MCDGLNAAVTPRSTIVVYKFGSSILDGPGGFREAAAEVHRAVNKGHRVVAVVSAMCGTTDALLSTAASLSYRPPDALVSRLLATGEAASVALFGIALAEAGLSACPLGPEALGLRTSGPRLDAEPRDVSVGVLHAAFKDFPVVVVPGFVGVDDSGELTLLGRGGSDLTALFLADRLGAEECSLMKDVDGIHTGDPRLTASTERIDRTTWCRAMVIGGGVVQDKALRFARGREVSFRVAALGGVGTVVGPEPAHAASVAP